MRFCWDNEELLAKRKSETFILLRRGLTVQTFTSALETSLYAERIAGEMNEDRQPRNLG